MRNFAWIGGPTIQAGEALSDAINLTAGIMVRITMPAHWHPDANLTFQVSTDGDAFNDLVGPDGNEVMINVVNGTAMFVPDEWARSVAHIKFRSGRRDSPQPQDDLREFAITLLLPDTPAP